MARYLPLALWLAVMAYRRAEALLDGFKSGSRAAQWPEIGVVLGTVRQWVGGWWR
jgi:hypothetical protein